MVSVVTVAASQPVLELIADSASITDQETATSLVYQPFAPCVPVTFGVMEGAVGSVVVTGETRYAWHSNVRLSQPLAMIWPPAFMSRPSERVTYGCSGSAGSIRALRFCSAAPSHRKARWDPEM